MTEEDKTETWWSVEPNHSLINTVTLPDPVTGVIWGNRKGCGEHLSLLLTCLISISLSSKCTHNKLCNAHTWRSGSKSGLALVAPHDTGKVNYVKGLLHPKSQTQHMFSVTCNDFQLQSVWVLFALVLPSLKYNWLSTKTRSYCCYNY